MRGDRNKQHKREQEQNTAATEMVDGVCLIDSGDYKPKRMPSLVWRECIFPPIWGVLKRTRISGRRGRPRNDRASHSRLSRMKLSGPTMMNRCVDGETSGARYRIGAPTVGGKWVSWWLWPCNPLAQSSGLKNSLKRRQKRANLLRHTARGGKPAVKLGLAKKANSYQHQLKTEEKR
jgi:hypothetical protein